MTIGRLMFLFQRYRGNVGIVSFILVIRLNVISSPIPLWWFIVGIVASVIYLWIDMKYIFPREAETGWLKNPEWVRLVSMVEDIQRKTNEH